ncbi:MAG: hypothetical protein ABH879_09085 [archaeon]
MLIPLDRIYATNSPNVKQDIVLAGQVLNCLYSGWTDPVPAYQDGSGYVLRGDGHSRCVAAQLKGLTQIELDNRGPMPYTCRRGLPVTALDVMMGEDFFLTIPEFARFLNDIGYTY